MATRTKTAGKTRKRQKIPETTRQFVLLEAGYKCANPACRHVLTLELHHIVWMKDGGGSQPDNLLALCPNCHSLHTTGHIPRTAILTWKSLLVSIGNPNRAAVDLLLVLNEEEKRVKETADPNAVPPPFRFTGDSLPTLAPLLTSGLVEISRRFLGANWFGGAHPSFEIALTERGRQLVVAWKAGSTEGIQRALSHEESAV